MRTAATLLAFAFVATAGRETIAQSAPARRAGPMRSPQREPAYTCDGCSSTLPTHYRLLPQSELGRLSRPYNLGAMLGRSSDEVRVSTQEVTEPVLYRHFAFGPSLELHASYFSDAYWAAHARYESQGRLDHPADRCPDRSAPGVLAWSDAGWVPLPSPN